jgi:GrpB-like predicted nucleotidyltransferase (UPF0157 family)/uncharacterized protein YhfF
VRVVGYDSAWPEVYDEFRERVRGSLGFKALSIEHVGSTAVPGHAAKPVIDIDLTVVDSNDEQAYVPALVAEGFVLDVREPWRHGHRMLRLEEPACNLHVWSLGSPQAARHLIFRDWLRENESDRRLYAAVKYGSVSTGGQPELVSRYDVHKRETVRLIYSRAFIASGLIDPDTLPHDEFAFPGPLRDLLVAAILDGSKTSTSTLLAEYEPGEALTTPGELRAVTDSEDRLVAVIRYEKPCVLPLGGIPLEHALAEGEGYQNVAQWRREHERFWSTPEFREGLPDHDFHLDDNTEVVCYRFELVAAL